jgi:hypothetical protein
MLETSMLFIGIYCLLELNMLCVYWNSYAVSVFFIVGGLYRCVTRGHVLEPWMTDRDAFYYGERRPKLITTLVLDYFPMHIVHWISTLFTGLLPWC